LPFPAGFELFPKAVEIGAQGIGEWFAREIPDHGAEFGIFVEADPMIDQPEMAVVSFEDMAAFAVGVIDDEIKESSGAEALAVFGREVEVVVVFVVRHVKLERTWAERAIFSKDGGGDKLPAELFADEVGGDFAQGEGGGGEVPERALSANGFVNGLGCFVSEANFDE